MERSRRRQNDRALLHFTAPFPSPQPQQTQRQPQQSQSANTVGYLTFETQDSLGSGWDDSWTAVGLPFGAPGTMEGTVIETTIFDRDVEANDQVTVYNPEAMDYEIYSFKGFDGDVSRGWDFLHYNNDWAQVHDSIMSFTVNYGEGILVTPNDYSKLTMSTAGQVANTEESQQWVMPAGLWTAPIMNPYPIATTFKDLESFAQVNDVLYVVNTAAQDCDNYSYLGEGNGWYATRWGNDWAQHYTNIPAECTDVILPAGAVGYYVNYNADGRVWTVTLPKADK